MPISANDCLAGQDLTEPRLSPDGRFVAYVRSGDETRIVVQRIDRAGIEIVSPWTVRAGRGLTGGCFDWIPDGTGVVAVTKSGELRMWHLSGSDRLLIETDGTREMSAPVLNADGSRLAYVVDQAEIREFELATAHDRRVDSGEFEFVLDPVWWNERLVWQAWSSPHMPWDESVLMTDNGPLRRGQDVQHQQPQSCASSGELGWLDDSSGWLNVAVDTWGRIVEEHEHGGPTWGERQRSWCFDDSGRRIAFVRNEGGFGRLCSVDLDTGRVVERAKAVHGQLSWRGEILAALRTGGKTPTQVVVYDTSGDEWTRTTIEVGSSFDWSTSSALVEPELLRVPAADSPEVDLHARLYRSSSSRRRLLCWVHGGPTDQWQVTFMPRLAYWLDRGYDVLVPDFRGSTGHGRTYTQALRGQWGIVDVNDVDTLLDDTMNKYGYTSSSVALLGSSAGGLTALCAAARRPEMVSAVVVAYPVSDIASLDDETHRFESHYNRSLVGSVSDTHRLSKDRSPLALVGALARVPLLLFHGSQDRVVPIDQSRRLVEALEKQDANVEFIVFDGEGHGFRDINNKIREYSEMERFLETHLRDGGPT